MMKVLHLSDIHLGSGLAYGKINPVTGLNTRLEDFINALSRCIDRAIAEPVDLVLFGGDAFPDATPAPFIQQAFANQFHRLVQAQIPIVLLVGNHDQHSQGQGGASLCIYRSLGVPGVVVGDRLETHRVQTRQGVVQIITLPWLTRSMLLTKPETQHLSLSEVNHLLHDRLRVALEGEIRRLQPDLPTILLGHLTAESATYGAERFLAVSKGFTIPLSLLTRPCFDYVALGHIHRHQVLCEHPPIVYPGSIERVDFSEENEEKGFVLVELKQGATRFEFCPLPTRPFRTISLNLAQQTDPQTDPQATILQAIQSANLEGAIVRLIYRLQPAQVAQLDPQELHQALSIAHTYTIQAELINKPIQSRLPSLGINNSLDPISALKTYLGNRDDLRAMEAELLAVAQTLLQENIDQDLVDYDASSHRLYTQPGYTPHRDPDQMTHIEQLNIEQLNIEQLSIEQLNIEQPNIEQLSIL